MDQLFNIFLAQLVDNLTSFGVFLMMVPKIYLSTLEGRYTRTILESAKLEKNCLTKIQPSSLSYGKALHKQIAVFSTVERSFCPFNGPHRRYESCNDSTIKAKSTARKRAPIYAH